MVAGIGDTIRLNNGVEIPQLGLGVFQSEPGDETEQAVGWAIAAGYRHIDTAKLYGNEHSVGRAVRRSGVDDVFVTTKVWNTDQGYDTTLEAFDASTRSLGFDMIDLYLVHWPVPSRGLTGETWRALEEVHEQGKVRAIGVSNFEPHHLDELLSHAKVTPAVNQVELHPYLQQREVRDHCAGHGIAVQAWSPLARGRVVDDPVLNRIGEKHGVSAVQVTIRWLLQLGVIALPKSVNQDRIVANAAVYGFELDDDDLATIEQLDSGRRIGPHPDTFG